MHDAGVYTEWQGRCTNIEIFGPSYLVLILFGRSVAVVTGLSFCGGRRPGKNAPDGTENKVGSRMTTTRRWTKKMKTTSSATTPAAASRVWRTHAVMTAGGSIGAHDLPLAPPRDFLFLFCCSNWFMYRTQSARRLAFGFSFIPALAVIFLRRFY